MYKLGDRIKTENNTENSTASLTPAANMDSLGHSAIPLPKFDGSSPFSRFVEDFEIYARIQGWDGGKKKDVLPLCLLGIARDAYDAVGEGQRGSFESIIEKMRENFQGKSTVDCHLALNKLRYRPGESLDAFVIQLRKLIVSAFPHQPVEGLMFNHFLLALPENYRITIVADGISSFDRALAKVRNLVSAAEMQSNAVRQVSDDTDPEVKRLQEKVSELEHRLETLNVQREPSFCRRVQQGPADKACFACGDMTHLKPSCRFRDAACYQCGRRGHISRVCRGRGRGVPNRGAASRVNQGN